MPKNGGMLYNNFSNKTVSCGECNFQRQIGKTGKAGEKWAKITMRLHHKVCSKTGRTDEVKHLVHNRSGDSSLIVNASITGARQVEAETEGINNQLERTTTYKRLFFR